MPEDRKENPSLCMDADLYVEDRGTIHFKDFRYSSGNTEFKVQVWDIKKRDFLWQGSPLEFWDLIMSALELKERMKTCPKCGGKENTHLDNCPIAQLAKKE